MKGAAAAGSSRELFRGRADGNVRGSASAATAAGASVTATAVIDRPAVPAFSPAQGLVLDVVGRRADGTVARTRFEGHVTREGGGTGAAAVAWYPGTQLAGTAIAATIGAATGTVRVSVGSVAADGSSYVVTILSTDAANAWAFQVTEKA